MPLSLRSVSPYVPPLKTPHVDIIMKHCYYYLITYPSYTPALIKTVNTLNFIITKLQNAI
jgi:hypothetical protein